MFAFKKVVATVVALAALSVPSLALASDRAPRDARSDDHASIQHRHDRDRDRDGRRDWRDRHDRDDRRDWRDRYRYDHHCR